MTTIKGHFQTYESEAEPFISRGEGDLFRLADRRYLYKRYHGARTSEAEQARLDEIIAAGRTIHEARKSLTGISAVSWPVDITTNADGVTGVIITRAPDRFYREDGGGVRDLHCLYLQRARPPSLGPRIAVLIRLMETMRSLREVNLVHGDVSASNVLWSISPSPRVYLIDADGLRYHHTPSGRKRFTLTWQDPRLHTAMIGEHDRYSDDWALAAMIWRVFSLRPDKLDALHLADDAKAVARLVPREYREIGDALVTIFSHPLETTCRLSASDWHARLCNVFLRPDGTLRTDLIARAEQAVIPDRRAVPIRPMRPPSPLPTVESSHESPQSTPVATHAETPMWTLRRLTVIAGTILAFAMAGVFASAVGNLNRKASVRRTGHHQELRSYSDQSRAFTAHIPFDWRTTSKDVRNGDMRQTSFVARNGWVTISTFRTNLGTRLLAKTQIPGIYWGADHTPLVKRSGYHQMRSSLVREGSLAYWRWDLAVSGAPEANFFYARCHRAVWIAIDAQDSLASIVSEAQPLLSHFSLTCSS